MSVFKRRRTNRAGKKTADNTWTVEFCDHQGVTRRVAAFTDRAASVELERQLRRLVSLRMGGLGVDVEASRFLESCPEATKTKLGEWGVISIQRAAAGKGMAEHITDWRRVMEAKGNSPRHIRNFSSNLKKLAASCKWSHLTDIASDNASDWVVEQRQAGVSAATINAFLRAGKAFCNWAIKAKRLTESPLKHVPLLNADADRRVERHPYSVNELGRLLAAAEAGEKHHGLTGYERALVYRLAVDTGFRYSEIRSLARSSFDFSGDRATVTILAADAKNGQDATLPLRDELAEELREYLTLHLPQAKAFRLWGGKGAAMIQQDLEAAGILARDADDKLVTTDEYGLSYDFHGLRHTFATMLNKAKVPLATAQKLMRHSDPKLTAKVYTHVMVDTKAEAIDMLPTIAATTPESQESVRTGTDDMPVNAVAKSADRLGDRNRGDFKRQITTYSDDGQAGKQSVSGMSGNEKAPVSQGKTGALTTGTRSATRTQDLLIKSQLLYQLS